MIGVSTTKVWLSSWGLTLAHDNSCGSWPVMQLQQWTNQHVQAHICVAWMQSTAGQDWWFALQDSHCATHKLRLFFHFCVQWSLNFSVLFVRNLVDDSVSPILATLSFRNPQTAMMQTVEEGIVNASKFWNPKIFVASCQITPDKVSANQNIQICASPPEKLR